VTYQSRTHRRARFARFNYFHRHRQRGKIGTSGSRLQDEAFHFSFVIRELSGNFSSIRVRANATQWTSGGFLSRFIARKGNAEQLERRERYRALSATLAYFPRFSPFRPLIDGQRHLRKRLDSCRLPSSSYPQRATRDLSRAIKALWSLLSEFSRIPAHFEYRRRRRGIGLRKIGGETAERNIESRNGTGWSDSDMPMPGQQFAYTFATSIAPIYRAPETGGGGRETEAVGAQGEKKHARFG